MITVEWDDTLEPIPETEGPPADIQMWDQWFDLVGLGEEWVKVKGACAQVGSTDAEVLAWARVVELTRLEALIDNKKTVTTDGRNTSTAGQ